MDGEILSKESCVDQGKAEARKNIVQAKVFLEGKKIWSTTRGKSQSDAYSGVF